MKTHVPKIRNVGKAFAEWINSEEKIAKVFRQLTELTADLARELLRTRRGRSKTLDRYAGKIDPILRLIAKRYPTQVELANFPFSDDMPVFDEQPVCPIRPGKRASAAALDKLKDAAAAAYGLRQFRWLADHGAFADFRRCALAACNKYFFPLRTEGRYCSKGCQRKHYMENPKRKEKNAADQKVNYYANKVLDLAKLAAVNADYQREYGDAKKSLRLAERAALRLKRG